MATRRYKLSVGSTTVTEEVGAATNSDTVELTVDLATTAVNVVGGTRAIQKEEVLLALDKMKRHILHGDWLPA